MQEDNKSQPKLQENEVDLGVFFTLIGRIVKKITDALNSLLIYLSEVLLQALIFLKRKIIWLALGFLIGLGFGLKEYFSNGTSYYSDMTVRSNFESARLLHNQIAYFNSLIKQHRSKDLAALFNISEQEAAKLISFEISPVSNDIEAAKLYKHTFLDDRRSKNPDSLWNKTINFTQFKATLSSYDYPLQEIRLYSYSPDVYTRIQDGIVRAVNNDKTLQTLKAGTANMLLEEEHLLNKSLQGLDSLRQAYYKRIELTSTRSGEGNNFYLSGREADNPEIELYDKELIFKDELIRVKQQSMDQQYILMVSAAFNPTGTKVYSLQQDFMRMALWGLLISLIILVSIELYKLLDKIDRQRRVAPEKPHHS